MKIPEIGKAIGDLEKEIALLKEQLNAISRNLDQLREEIGVPAHLESECTPV